MRPFSYAAPDDRRAGDRACWKPDGSEALAGGTDLLSLLKDDVEQVERLVALRGIAEPVGRRHLPVAGSGSAR